jgi:hypothetical protein
MRRALNAEADLLIVDHQLIGQIYRQHLGHEIVVAVIAAITNLETPGELGRGEDPPTAHERLA